MYGINKVTKKASSFPKFGSCHQNNYSAKLDLRDHRFQSKEGYNNSKIIMSDNKVYKNAMYIVKRSRDLHVSTGNR